MRFTAPLVVLSAILVACSPDSPTSPAPPKPQFAISDGVHGGGVTGLYFLPPMVPQPSFTGTFDGDIATLNPRVAICDVTNGPDTDCGGATAAIIVFTTTSTPAITVDLTTPQYQVNWDTKGTGFVAGNTYRLHVTAGAASARRELGFADVLLTTTPGQVKDLAGNDLVVLKDGRTLPVHLRIESGIAGGLGVSAGTASVTTGGTDLLTATVQDLHGALLAGATVAWASTSTPATGVVASLTPTAGPTNAGGQAMTTLTAGATQGTATVTAGSAGMSASVTVTITPAGCDCWTTKASMPTARGSLATSVVNGILFAVGGNNNSGNTTLATVEAYDPVANAWTTKASMPTARNSLATVTINGIIYALGGTNQFGSIFATVEAYDPSTNSWATKASMPTARFGLATSVANGILYAVGGINGSGPLTTVEAYDPSTNTWTTKASMPTAREYFGTSVANGIIYAVGGQPGGGALSTVEAYDPVANTWTTKASMPTARNSLATVTINGIIYAVGGFLNPNVLATVEAYDPISNTWTTRPSMPTARSNEGADVVNGILYATAGVDASNNPFAILEAYQP